MTESDRNKYLRVALLVVGLIFIFGICTHDCLAFRLGVSRRRSLGISWDDLGCVCDARRVLDNCLTRSNGAQKPYLVHGLVQFRAWGDHGLSIHRGRPAYQTFVGRCLGSNCCGGCIGSLDPSTDYCRRIASRSLTSFQHLCRTQRHRLYDAPQPLTTAVIRFLRWRWRRDRDPWARGRAV